MARIAFIGLGTMGLPMARHLVAAGHSVVGCDLDRSRAVALGAEFAGSPAEAVERADAALTSLPGPDAVADVVRQLAGAARAGTVVIEMSTSPPALMRELAAELHLQGLDFLDAPVSGGPLGAEAATLAIMVGGDEAVFGRWRGLLEPLAQLVVHVGGHGAGQTLKLCNNLVAGTEMAAIAEACAILERQGVDPAVAFDVLTRSTSDSRVLRMRFPIGGVRDEHPSSRAFEPMFALDLIHKDLTLALALAEESGVAARVAASALETYSAARAQGLGGRDYSAVYELVRA